MWPTLEGNSSVSSRATASRIDGEPSGRVRPTSNAIDSESSARARPTLHVISSDSNAGRCAPVGAVERAFASVRIVEANVCKRRRMARAADGAGCACADEVARVTARRVRLLAAAANQPPAANQLVRAGSRPGAPARQRATHESAAVTRTAGRDAHRTLQEDAPRVRVDARSLRCTNASNP
ncbi:hypothetical protein PR003_g24565 [Phytophthora rubi]|uniref:Uncharacterized protein n=1 Tax=Phytophthora rubi TaxID=129364 RepID=A0A6A3HL18_9STRA|nr:hypothetical protein PR002_g27149 [Phytophthora rubi]KAE8971716.1 hypothetical protein PR001_g26808 [Phytophthora rubi]KAE9293202.1 hypothetical protein PR003_g24565 [Phytophthora rubi]